MVQTRAKTRSPSRQSRSPARQRSKSPTTRSRSTKTRNKVFVVRIDDRKDYTNHSQKVLSSETDAYMYALVNDWRSLFQMEDSEGQIFKRASDYNAKFPAFFQKWCATHGYAGKSPKFVYNALIRNFFREKRIEHGVPLDPKFDFDDDEFNDTYMIAEIEEVVVD